MMRLFFSTGFLVLFNTVLICQSSGIIDKKNIQDKIIQQVLISPREKLYLQTDRSLYLPGEKLWLRAYLVDAVIHKPDTGQYVYVELKNPVDSLISRIMLKCNHGAYYGCMPLKQNLPQGDYTLTAYSTSMFYDDNSSFFRKSIRIAAQAGTSFSTETDFGFEKKNEVSCNLCFRRKTDRGKLLTDGLRIWVNGKPVTYIRMRKDSVYSFSFTMPDDKKERIMYIENNRYRQFLSVPFPPDDFDVSFYPEGGYLLEGTECRVSFKAMTSGGIPEKITGIVVDSLGNTCSRLRTMHDGMGIFSITPEKGKSYFAECVNEYGKSRRFALPSSVRNMCALKSETSDSGIYLSVLRSEYLPQEKNLYVVMHTRGMVHYASEWKHGDTAVFFNTRKFPSGVMQILLLDSQMNKLSERLVFCRNNDQPHVLVETDKSIYGTRQLVTADVQAVNMEGGSVVGSFSVSVTNDSDVLPDSVINIYSSLLLASDLKGTIINPSWYFADSSEIRRESLDLLMMTNGWNRYEIPDVIKGKYKTLPVNPKLPMEISGQVKTLPLGKPAPGCNISVFSWKKGFYFGLVTDDNGHFDFRGYEYPDSTAFIVKAINKKGKDKGLELLFDNPEYPSTLQYPSFPFVVETQQNDGKNLQIRYLVQDGEKYTIKNGLKTIYLDEIVVQDKAPVKEEYGDSFYLRYSNINPRDIITDKKLNFSQYQNAVDIIRNNFPFITVQEQTSSDGFTRPAVYIDRMRHSFSEATSGGGYEAAIVVDDIVMHDFDLSMLNASDIESIAVLRGTKAAILGSDAIGGAIVITTKNGADIQSKTTNFSLKTTMPLGYQQPVEFYSPVYDTPEKRAGKEPDTRTTIYWNPDIKLSQRSGAAFYFYTADGLSDYTMTIEGITNDGYLIQNTTRIKRK